MVEIILVIEFSQGSLRSQKSYYSADENIASIEAFHSTFKNSGKLLHKIPCRA